MTDFVRKKDYVVRKTVIVLFTGISRVYIDTTIHIYIEIYIIMNPYGMVRAFVCWQKDCVPFPGLNHM